MPGLKACTPSEVRAFHFGDSSEADGGFRSLKSLTVVKFEEDSTDGAKEGERACICPVCRKSLTNNVKAYCVFLFRFSHSTVALADPRLRTQF